MRPRMFVSLFLLALLALPASAVAGGWATVGLSSTPEGVAHGQPWKVRIEVLQHGRTPLAGVKPTIKITDRATGATRVFAARPTTRAGTYRARVVFPSAGRWTYAVNDGFGQDHQFAPVEIGSGKPTAIGGESDPPWTALAAALLAAVAAGLVTARAQRRRHRSGPTARPAPAARG